MFQHDIFEFPRLTQQNRPEGRVYQVEDGGDAGQTFPSITRVLAAKPNPGILAWRKRVGETEANRVSREATTRGTSVHALAEAYLDNTLDESAPITLTVFELWRTLRPWIAEHVTTLHAQEQDIYSTRLRVAGRMDALATVDDKLTVIDFKTSSKPKSREHIGNYFVQSTFYALAVYERTGRKVEQIVIPIVSPERLQVFTTTPTEHFSALKDAIRFFYTTTHDTIDITT
jgi:hypothetical protein